MIVGVYGCVVAIIADKDVFVLVVVVVSDYNFLLLLLFIRMLLLLFLIMVRFVNTVFPHVSVCHHDRTMNHKELQPLPSLTLKPPGLTQSCS